MDVEGESHHTHFDHLSSKIQILSPMFFSKASIGTEVAHFYSY